MILIAETRWESTVKYVLKNLSHDRECCMAKQNDLPYQQSNMNNHAGDSVVSEQVRPLRQWLGFEPLYQGRKMALQSEKTCLDFFYEAAQATPKAPALTVGEQTLSYEDIVASVDALAAWMLKDIHTNAADRVALYLPNSLSYVVGVLAAWRANLIVANINFLTENNNILKQLQDSGAKNSDHHSCFFATNGSDAITN
jgi:non-ribosomal peptide synthetase component F